eukprot:347826_1
MIGCTNLMSVLRVADDKLRKIFDHFTSHDIDIKQYIYAFEYDRVKIQAPVIGSPPVGSHEIEPSVPSTQASMAIDNESDNDEEDEDAKQGDGSDHDTAG